MFGGWGFVLFSFKLFHRLAQTHILQASLNLNKIISNEQSTREGGLFPVTLCLKKFKKS